MQNTSHHNSCCNFSELRVIFDNICDFIPVVSTISMTIGAAQKYLYVPEMEVNNSLKGDHYYTHLKNKDFERYWLLFVPGVNFVVAIMAYVQRSSETSKMKPDFSTIINNEGDNDSSQEVIDSEKNSEKKKTVEEKKTAEDKKGVEDEIKSNPLIEKPKILNNLYPGININDIIQMNRHIAKADFKELLYDILINESPRFYLSSSQIKRAIEALSLCDIDALRTKVALINIFNIIDQLPKKSSEILFAIISSLQPEHQIQNIINASNFLMHTQADPTFSISILQKISKLPIANILLFEHKNWNNLTTLANFVNSSLLMDSQQEILDPLLDRINKAFRIFDPNTITTQASATAIVQIICHLSPENSEKLFKVISNLKSRHHQIQNLINAASYIEKNPNPKDDFTLTLLILQKISNTPNANNLLFSCKDWETLSIICNITRDFPKQWEKIVDSLLVFSYQKIQNYKNIQFKSYDSQEVKEIDIEKIIISSDIFMKDAWLNKRKQNVVEKVGLNDVVMKLVKIPQAQYKVLTDTFLNTIQNPELSVKKRLKILDRAVLHDMIIDKCCLLRSACIDEGILPERKEANKGSLINPIPNSDIDIDAFTQVIATTILPFFKEVMQEK